MKKTISILGSTGSIGKTVLNIVDKKKSFFRLNTFIANANFFEISKQILKYKPNNFVINDYQTFVKIKNKHKKSKTKFYNSFREIKNFKKNDISVCAIPGIAGLEPTIKYSAISKNILLANKESIICGWDILQKIIKKNKTNLIPIDSEHYSIMKLLNFNNKEDIEKIYITASGGPFFKNKIKIKNIKLNHALKHPKWSMGKKISIDSATLMNKLFELIEAKKLFSKHKNKIDILIHPQSLVHAIIKYKNGLSTFLYHEPDMTIPIANAMFNSRVNIDKFYLKKNTYKNNFNLNFYAINKKNFPPFNILKKINSYKSFPIILNASNEILVDCFLKKIIQFQSILPIMNKVLRDKNFKKYAIQRPSDLENIYNIDKWARKTTLALINKNEKNIYNYNS